jgi:hypothetical protein
MSAIQTKPAILPERDARTAVRPAVRPVTPAPVALRLLPLVVGLACWGFALTRLHLDTLGTYGLLAAVDVWFYIGLALLIGGFAKELCRPERATWIPTLYVLGTVVVIYATVPLLFHAPELAWVYKHVGVAQSLQLHGRVTEPWNIYQEWPAFFSALAGVSSLSGAGALAFAAWARLFFELANCLMLMAIFRTMTRDDRVPILAVLLFQCFVCWVSEDYLSPQAFDYVLWLGLVLLLLRWLSSPAPVEAARGRLGRIRRRLLRGIEYRPAPSAPVYRGAVVAAIGVFFVIVAAHQLTPVVALVGIGVLAALDLLRPRWLVLALAAIFAGYVSSRYHLISTEYGGFFSSFNFFENASGHPITGPGAGSSGQAFTSTVLHCLVVGMWLGALGVLVRWRRTPGRFVVPAVLGFSPFAILLVQNYGTEGIYRVVLFSAPWCAYLIATAVVRLRRSQVRAGAMALVPGLALLAGLQGLYGPVTVNAFTPAEVNASIWMYGHTPADSTLVLAADNFPVLETAASWEREPALALPDDPQAGPVLFAAGNLPSVDRWVTSLGHAPIYLVLSRSMASYSAYYGLPKGYEQLKHSLPSSPEWSVYFQNRDVTIYRFTPAGRSREAPRPRRRPPPPSSRRGSRPRAAHTPTHGGPSRT